MHCLERNNLSKFDRIRLSKIAKLAQVQKSDRILDLGSCDSRLQHFLPLYCDYIGVDIKPKVENIIKWNLEAGLPQELTTKTFDVIFMNDFIEHIENFKSLIIQCGKLISDEGRIIISTPSANRFIFREDPTHIHCFRKSNMENLAKTCGLNVIKKSGTYIKIPIINIAIPTNQTLYSDVLVFCLVKPPSFEPWGHKNV